MKEELGKGAAALNANRQVSYLEAGVKPPMNIILARFVAKRAMRNYGMGIDRRTLAALSRG